LICGATERLRAADGFKVTLSLWPFRQQQNQLWNPGLRFFSPESVRGLVRDGRTVPHRADEINNMATPVTPMKKQNKSQWLNPLLALACAALMAGCASSNSGYQQADQTGEAINTLRTDVLNIKKAVDASMKAMDDLAASASKDPRKAYEAFAKSVTQVENAGNTAKKNAETMQAKGAEYFKQWETQIATVQNEKIRDLAQKRKAKLQEAFGNIKKSAQDAKESFPIYLADLKDLRTALSTDLTVQGISSLKGVFKKTKKEGVEVKENLDDLEAELNTVVAAITAAKEAAKPAEPAKK
jgi:transcriptional regulator with PAS, ATPase and Fis domain